MVIVFHEADDDHAPFPHRVLTISGRVARSIHGGSIEYPDRSHIICAECDHDITRVVPMCACQQRCHELGELLASLTPVV